MVVRSAEVSTTQFLKLFVIPLTTFPKSVHFIIYLLGIEGCQLLS